MMAHLIYIFCIWLHINFTLLHINCTWFLINYYKQHFNIIPQANAHYHIISYRLHIYCILAVIFNDFRCTISITYPWTFNSSKLSFKTANKNNNKIIKTVQFLYIYCLMLIAELAENLSTAIKKKKTSLSFHSIKSLR